MFPGADKAVLAVLEGVIAGLKTDDLAWENLLEGHAAAEIVRWRDDFRAHVPVPVLGYPREKTGFPQWAIMLLAESPEASFCGGGSGGLTSESPPRELFEMVTGQRIAVVVCYPNSGDGARVHSLLVKAALLAGITELLDDGMEGANFSGSEDLSPQAMMLPATIWCRAQYWEFPSVQTAVQPLPSTWVHGPVRVALDDVVIDDAGRLGQVHPATEL